MNQQKDSSIPNPKMSKKELAAREVYYRRLFETAKDGILIIDAATGVVKDINPFLEQTLGYPRRDIVNKAVWELGFLKGVFTDKAKLVELQQQEYARYDDLPLTTADGRHLDVELVSSVYDVEYQKLIQLNIRNISQRKEAEANLKESEERFRLMFDLSPIGAATASPDLGFLRVNAKMRQMLGYTEEEFNRLTFRDVTYPEDLAKDIEGINDLRDGKIEQYITDKRYVRKDGGIIWGQLSVSLMRDKNGQPSFYIPMLVDITERKKTQEMLESSKRVIEGIINAIPVRVFWKDKNLVYLGCNIVFARDAGFETPEDIIGKTDYEMGWRDQAEAYRTDDLDVINSGRPKLLIEEPQTTPEGKTITLLTSKMPLIGSHGEVNGVIGIYLDITERKKAEESVLHAAEEWRTTFDSIADMVSIQDRDFKIVRVNAAYAKALGMPEKDIVGKTCFELVHGTKEPVDSCPHQVTIRTSKPASFESHDADRNTYAEVSTFPIFDERHEVTGTVHIVHDITERKRAEADQQILRDKTEMTSRLAAVGEMAAGVAHEINNPLTGVIGFSELLLERPGLPEDVKEELRIINDGSQRVRDIVKRMLTFARQVEPQRRNVSINELLDNTLELRDYVLKTANIKVVKDYDPDLPWVNADPGQLQQVFLNLIVNAEYAMKKGIEQGILTLKTWRLDDHIRISIADNGTGMSEATLAKLFQPFFTTKDPGEGTGLGLSLSHGIIQEHFGTIRAESVIGRGTTFVIDLPITPVEIAPIVEEPLSEPVQAVKHARILVVDDEPTVRSLVRTILSRGGHLVEECDDSRQVLNKLQETNYDIVLLDLRMPGMSGMELFSEISARWPNLARRVIFITGDTSDLDTREYLASHQIQFITKPFVKKTLEDKVNVLLTRASE